MRLVSSALFLVLASAAACSVPDKQPVATTDAGMDAGSAEPTGAPDTTITAAPAEFSNTHAATFEFESNDARAHFVCSLDGESPQSCTSPYVKDLPDGTHSFSVKAINDGGDGDDTPAEHLWSIDTVAPETTLTAAPPAADNSTSVRFEFMSNEMNTTFECSLDGAGFAACRTGDEVGPITDGAHTFSVRAKDRAGNVDGSPAVHTWTVDTSTPDTTLISGPAGSVSSTSATFSFLSPDAGSGATFQCSLDGSGFTTCTSPKTYSNLEMGSHSFAVRVKDVNGNLDPTPATRTWTIDGTPPQTTITDAPSGSVAMASAIIEFTSNEANVTYACSLDGAAAAACTSPFSVTGLAQGAHSFSVVATDMAANADPTPATASWTVDTVSPDLPLTGPNDGDTIGPRVSYSWTASEGTVECRIDGAAWAACASPYAFNLPMGAHTFEIRSTDGAGNVTSLSRSVTVACSPPDATGATGLLHLDEDTQTLANATGGAGAVLGISDQVEPQDPVLGSGRFNGGAVFTASDNDQINWPLAAGTAATFSIELWSQPDALSGTREVFATGDARVAIRVTADGSATVHYSATVVGSDDVIHTVSSGSYAAGDWHQVDVSLSGSTLRLWVDGDRTDISDASIGSAPAFDMVRVGTSYGGSIDEVYLAATAFATDEDVLARYCPANGPRL